MFWKAHSGSVPIYYPSDGDEKFAVWSDGAKGNIGNGLHVTRISFIRHESEDCSFRNVWYENAIAEQTAYSRALESM